MHNTLTRILLVDDDPDIRLVAQRSLEAVGSFIIEPCCSGDDALSKAEQFEPDIILMDVMMQGKDGPATLAELRQIERLCKTPIVFMTARVQKQEVEEYISLGAADVIPKPFDPMALSQQVQKIWELLKTQH